MHACAADRANAQDAEAAHGAPRQVRDPYLDRPLLGPSAVASL